MPVLTQEQYIRGGGNQCPHCASLRIEGKHVDIQGAFAYQEITCNGCDASWVDRFQLAGYATLDPGTATSP